MITAELICDSVNPAGNRLSTFVLTYPRFIHSEFMTHRCFSRNAASSRAIPIYKMIQAVNENTAMPIFWGKNQKGMQAAEEIVDVQRQQSKAWWMQAAFNATLEAGYSQASFDLHKQIANRVLEPFSHITVIATASDVGLRNFFALRAHKDAQPEFQALAYAMLGPWLDKNVTTLKWGDWHIPFYDPTLKNECENIYGAIRICTGRIARVSYLTHDGVRDPGADLDLHDRLLTSKHMSPFEHCAQARFERAHWGSNFGTGWLQYRKTLNEECQAPTDGELFERLASAPAWALNPNS